MRDPCLYTSSIAFCTAGIGRWGEGQKGLAVAQVYLHGVGFQQQLALLRLVGVHSLGPLQGLQILPVCDQSVQSQPDETEIKEHFMPQPSLKEPWGFK